MDGVSELCTMGWRRALEEETLALRAVTWYEPGVDELQQLFRFGMVCLQSTSIDFSTDQPYAEYDAVSSCDVAKCLLLNNFINLKLHTSSITRILQVEDYCYDIFLSVMPCISHFKVITLPLPRFQNSYYQSTHSSTTYIKHHPLWSTNKPHIQEILSKYTYSHLVCLFWSDEVVTLDFPSHDISTFHFLRRFRITFTHAHVY
jgi:hypothetical protein